MANIYISTDASYSDNLRIGTYAYYISVGDQKIKDFGKFSQRPEHSTQCELMAIGNAVSHALRLNLPTNTENIIISTDCKACIQYLSATSTGKKPAMLNVARKIKPLLSQLQGRTGGEIIIKHVRAHTRQNDKASTANNWCDRQARRALFIAISQWEEARRAERLASAASAEDSEEKKN